MNPACQVAAAPRRLIINADDFGLSESVNHAVLDAHLNGILTTASLMVNEPGFDQAVSIARSNPRLGVGLHLTLLCGKSALNPKQIPHLVDANGRFSNNPAACGFRYSAQPGIKNELKAEIEAQICRFHSTGLPLDHVNGHLHLHLHPTVLDILLSNAEQWGIRQMRLTCEPLRTDLCLSSGNWFYRLSHALIFGRLSARARSRFAAKGIRHTGAVFGLLQNSRVDEHYVYRLLPMLPPGDSELYSHPSLNQFKTEHDALVSPRVKALAQDLGIRLIRYQDL